MKVKKDYILREIANEVVVVPTGKEAIRFNGMLTLNRSAKILFEALYQEQTKDSLVNLLLDTYDISQEQAIKDVDEFLLILEERKILE